MSELDNHDLRIIIYALQTYNVHQEWSPLHKESIEIALNKIQEKLLSN